MKKETFVVFISILFFFACNPDTSDNNVGNGLIDSSALQGIEKATTALNVVPAPLPPSFILDTLSFEDTSKHLFAFFHFPVSNDEKLNELVIHLVKENTKGYEDYHPQPYENTNIEAWISAFAINGQLLSMCFMDQSYTDGAAHYNHGYTAMNYDTVKQKQIFLTDIFQIKTEKEKQDFCNTILSPEIYSETRLETTDLKKEADFMIEKGNVIFYFDDYEKGPSMTKITIELRRLSKFIKKDYEWLTR